MRLVVTIEVAEDAIEFPRRMRIAGGKSRANKLQLKHEASIGRLTDITPHRSDVVDTIRP